MKSGIPYFPLDCELDSKIELIEAEFGLNGFGVVVKLFQKIYGEQGYYFEWTNEVALLFAHKVGLGGNAVSEIVSAAVRRGIFDQKLFDTYHVLTSRGIQKRYFDAVSRRKQIEVINDYLLVNVTDLCKNVDIQRGNVSNNGKNVYILEQRKAEESREENIAIAEDAWESAFACPVDKRELMQLVKSYGQPLVVEAIERAFNASAETPIAYIKTVLKSWKLKGITTRQEIGEYDTRD